MSGVHQTQEQNERIIALLEEHRSREPSVVNESTESHLGNPGNQEV
jgi:hypothetical protein